jgi:FixJ family two-component response regulator
VQAEGLIEAHAITQDRNSVRVSLVDGDPTVRRARQIMLRSEGYQVRSYSTSAALLDAGLDGSDALDLIRQMRATDWQGTAILLAAFDSTGALTLEAALHGDIVFPGAVGDRTLTTAIKTVGLNDGLKITS